LYDDEKKGLDYKPCDLILKVTQQSPDINQAIKEDEQGAGDQAHIFGYSIDKTSSLFLI
jgi:S-adenosylmethionine synthetase